MNPVPAALLTAAITVLSRWARNKEVGVDIVVGLAGIAIGLAILSEINTQFARAMGALIVVGTLVAQGPDLFDAIRKATGDASSGTASKRRPTLGV